MYYFEIYLNSIIKEKYILSSFNYLKKKFHLTTLISPGYKGNFPAKYMK